MGFCDCGCIPCYRQTAPHLSCPYECEERTPQEPDRRKVLGGKPGREIIAVE
jgi:hypothetical protein